jgi:4-hydroxybenzoate polyprenyltransferase
MLALTFNIGVLIAYSAITNSISIDVLFLYLAGIFWTLGYDTIYAYQDIDDDLSIGVKSTAILFGEQSKYWISSFLRVLSKAAVVLRIGGDAFIPFIRIIPGCGRPAGRAGGRHPAGAECIRPRQYASRQGSMHPGQAECNQ